MLKYQLVLITIYNTTITHQHHTNTPTHHKMSHSNSNLSDNEAEEVVLSTKLTSDQRQTDQYYIQLQSIMLDNGWQLQKDNGEDPDFNGNEYFTHPTYNGKKARVFTYQTYLLSDYVV